MGNSDSQDSPRPKLGGKPPPSPLLYTLCFSTKPTYKWHFVSGLPNGSLKIGNLTPSPSFGHNLCFKCPNGWCEPILDIYVSIFFQWYKKIFDPLGFDTYDYSMNIWESIRTPIPKVEVPLGVWRFIPSYLLSFPGFLPWLATLQALALVTSPKLGLQHV